MIGSMGVYFGVRHVTAIAMDRRGHVSDFVEIPRKTEEGESDYTHDEFTAIVAELKKKFGTGHVLIPSLPMNIAFYRRVNLDKKHRNAETLRYALEPTLPIPIEAVHTTMMGEADTSVGALAIPLHPWKHLLDLMDEQGWISPRAVCAGVCVWEVLRGLCPASEILQILCLWDREEGAILAGSPENLLAARSLAYRHSDTKQEGSAWVAHEIARTAWFCGMGAQDYSICVLTNQSSGGEISFFDSSVKTLDIQDVLPDLSVPTWGACYAYCAARSVVTHAPTNLRTGEFRSRRIAKGNRKCVLLHSLFAMAAAMVLSFGLFLYGRECHRQGETYQRSCRNIWTGLFPDKTPLANVFVHLRSEMRREEGLRKEDVGISRHRPALFTLRGIVSTMPKDIPVRISEIDISGDSVLINGHARTHGEVESIANGIAQQKELKVMPATTERVSDGTVRFTLRLEFKEPQDGKQAA